MKGQGIKKHSSFSLILDVRLKLWK